MFAVVRVAEDCVTVGHSDMGKAGHIRNPESCLNGCDL